ncbi:DUF4065 domain-containing protein [Bacillus altitudinis]|uniref:Panacea domain-containing protein n=1 Tax=Bacillus altitudinis TaxID=293387 RepID=UPI003458898F
MAAIDVARYLLNLSTPFTGESVTNLKLQKLLYYAQGFHLALHGTPLFDEDIQAWAHGPVVPEVYFQYKGYQFSDIEEKYPEQTIIITSNQRELINDVWEVFKSYDGKELERLSHTEDPWKNARGNLPEYASSNVIIEKDLIKLYFENEYVR